MNESSLTPAKVVSIALHIGGAFVALAHLVLVLVFEGMMASLTEKVLDSGSGGVTPWLLIVPLALGGSVVIQLVFSALAILVRNSARTADATERLAETIQRLDLSHTTDGGLYYRIR